MEWTLDDVSAGLQRMRVEAGNSSYTDIANRITRRRMAGGQSQHAASVSRTTVYSVFQPGRTRMKPNLVFEIVLALTADEAGDEIWRSRCIAAQIPAEVTQTVVAEQPERTLPQNSAAAVTKSISVSAPGKFSWLDPARALRFGAPSIVAIIGLGVLINVIVFQVAHRPFSGNFPLFADMAGTAVVAIVLGPLWGAITAVASSTLNAALGISSIQFAPVAVVGALVWGYGVHRFRGAASLFRMLLLNVAVGAACTLTAYVVLNLSFDGSPMMPSVELMAASMAEHGVPWALALLAANLVIPILDKMMIGIVALMIAGSALRKYAPPALVRLISTPHDTATDLTQRVVGMKSILLWS
jgi:energy-coupling factor transport system substrate-specific component